VRWDAVDVFRFSNGRIAEEWGAEDTTAILYQLGWFTPPWLQR
jgi:predicted ester cyclase